MGRKLIAVYDLVTTQQGRMIPDSKRPSDIPDTIQIQIVPKGILNIFRKVWIKNIPKEGGMTEPLTPSDTSLPGTEPMTIYILAHASKEKMRGSIVQRLKIIAVTTIRSLQEAYEMQTISADHYQQVAKEKSAGVNSTLSDTKKIISVMGINSSDNDKNKNKNRKRGIGRGY